MFSIQQVTPADIDILINLSRETFYNSYYHLTDPDHFEDYIASAFDADKLLAELNDPDSAFYFAILNDEVTGYLKLNFGAAQSEFRDENAMEIERIYLLKQYHGQQFGRQLINFAIQTAKDKQLQYIWLGVWQKNPKAIGFYEHNGFKVCGTHTFRFGGEDHDDLMMKLELGEK